MSILTEADGLINGPRVATYGHALDNFTAIATFWQQWVFARYGEGPVNLDADDVAVMMALLKLARLAKSPTHRDSIVDAAGYIGTLEQVQSKRTERAIQDVVKGLTSGSAGTQDVSSSASILDVLNDRPQTTDGEKF